MIELLDLKVDVVFKDFFGDKSSKEILESFINSILDLKGDETVEIEEFLDPRKMRIEVGKPSTFVDLSVKTRRGERYIIEMQTYNHEGFDKRLLYYLGKDYTEQIEYQHHHPEVQGKRNRKLIGWRDLPKVHVIAVIDFHRDPKAKDGILNHSQVVETYRFRPELAASNNHLFDHWKATIVDLKKFKSRPINKLEEDKEIWIYILNNAPSLKEEERAVLRKDPVFQKALARLEMLSSDPKTRKAYEASINDQRDHLATLDAAEKKGLEKGFQKGREEGFEQGRTQERQKLARALLKEGLSLQRVAKITGLSPGTIRSLKK